MDILFYCFIGFISFTVISLIITILCIAKVDTDMELWGEDIE
ncbi:MAG: hypothetical protein ACK5M3_13115 [Dysgonomonas sp.]